MTEPAIHVHKARRGSRCALCGAPITIGQQITDGDTRGWSHARCYIAERRTPMISETATFSFGEVGHDPPVHIVRGPWVGPREVRRSQACNVSLCGKRLSRSRGRPQDPDILCGTCRRLSTAGDEVQPVLSQLSDHMQELHTVNDQDYEIRFIPLGELVVDMAAYGDGRLQRTEQVNWTKKIAVNFDWRVFNRRPPMVSARADGTYHVMDGQHAISAARLAGHAPSTLVRCHVWHGLSVEDEAAMFRQTNAERKSVKPIDLFRARIAERDPVAVAIQALLSSHGWHIGSHGKAGNFAAVRTLEAIYRKSSGPEICHKTLSAITEAWDREPDSAHQTVVKVLGLFFQKYPDADLARLARVLRREASLQPHRIQMWPKENREAWQETSVVTLRERYNNRLDARRRLS